MKKLLISMLIVFLLLSGAVLSEGRGFDKPLSELDLDELLTMKSQIDSEILVRFNKIDGIVLEPGVYIVGEDIPEGNYFFEGVEGRRFSNISVYSSFDEMDPYSYHQEATGIGFDEYSHAPKSGKMILKNGNAVDIDWGPAIIHPYLGLMND